MGNNNFKKYQYKGAIHIHSLNSDGSGDIETITRAAQKAGLSWIIITDHNYFDLKEGIYNNVYVLKGEEISPKNKNHYLALGINCKKPLKINPLSSFICPKKQNKDKITARNNSIKYKLFALILFTFHLMRHFDYSKENIIFQ